MNKVKSVLPRSAVTGQYGWNLIPNVYVSSTGNDANDGLTSGTPLATIAEVMRRLGDQVIDGEASQLSANGGTIYVNLIGGPFSADTVVRARFANGGGLAFVGTETSVLTGTIGVVTAANFATGTIGSYSLTGTPSMTAHVGQMMRVMSGAHTGYWTPIAKDLGSGVFRGNWIDWNNTFAYAEPSVNDAVQISTLTKIGGNVEIDTEGDGYVYFQLCDLGMTATDHTTSIRVGQVQFLQCVIRGFDAYLAVTDLQVSGCLTYDFRVYGQAELWSNVHMSVGGQALSAEGGGVIVIYGATLCQGYGCSAGGPLEPGGTILVSDPTDGGGPLIVADYASSDAVSVGPGAQIIARDRIFIRDAAGGSTGYHVFGGGGLYYTSGEPPVSYGTAPATQFALVGNIAKTSGQIPFFDTASGGAIVVYQ